jgi:hypothetical protein
MFRGKPLMAAGLLAAASLLPVALSGPLTGVAGNAGSKHIPPNCAEVMCAEVANPASVFGNNYYVGHDEPSTIFYSNRPGSGNNVAYNMVLPTDPSATSPTTPGKSYTFELNPTFWFGMALCDTQSYPEQVSTCPANSDSNILDPAISPKHVGTAFVELQFYSPGWVPWPVWQVANGATTCDATKWCAAMNIFSLLQDPTLPIGHQTQNGTCLNQIGSPEFVNFAFVTKNGVATGPANPVQATTSATYTPNPAKDLFMSSGDLIGVNMHDTANGLKVVLDDKTSHQSGSMTASPANGFAQIQFDPTGTSCNVIPYAFHPMYSTSSEQTRVVWAAHTYNVAFSNEIGHFENCQGPNAIPASQFGLDNAGNPITCPTGNMEGRGASAEPTDGDDNFCFPGSEALTVHINGCTDTNVGFDNLAYQSVWPDGNTALHPTSVLFSSATTGGHQYDRVAFEADLPRIESPCNRSTGAGCTLIPQTDDGNPADFYPFFSITRAHAGDAKHSGGDCFFQFGNHIPGSANDFGQNAEYGTLLQSTYISVGGSTITRYNNFRQILNNPCPA